MDVPNEPPPQEVLPETFPLVEGLLVHDRPTERQFLLEDTARRKFFRLGFAEGSFVAALVETRSPALAYERCCENADHSISMENAIKLCKWLAGNGLTTLDGSPTAPPQTKNVLASAFFWKVPLGNPDNLLIRINNNFGWLFSAQAMLIGLGVFVFSILQTTGHWTAFFSSYQDLFSSWRWVTLAIGWCILKIIHETAHGATCRRYGGEVNKAGLAMILMMPIAFVDVTSSWRFPSRWQRLHVTLAGVAAEFFVAGLALCAWHWCESLPLKQAAADIFMLASISSVLFNLNPLLKFDGYFAIADASGIDNLYSYGQSYARYFGGRYILGLAMQPPALPGTRPGWIKFYGISSALYRVVTVTGLIATAAALFEGAGIVIAIAGVFGFIVKPLCMLATKLFQLRGDGTLSTSRLVLRLTCIAGLMGAVLFSVPADWSWTSPAIVQYDPPAVVRTRSAGFVEQIHVVDGERVTQGQPIVTLRNDDLLLEFANLKKELAQTHQEVLLAQWTTDSSALGDAQTRTEGLQEQLEELQTQVDSLVLRAPVAGTLVARGIEILQGTYLETGAELAVVGCEDCKRLKVSISQFDAKQAEDWADKPLRVIIDGHQAFTANLSRMESRADATPPDAALLAINGGALSVQQTDDEMMLCAPRVNAYVPLSPSQSEIFRTGQRASVTIASRNRSLGQELVRVIQLHANSIFASQ